MSVNASNSQNSCGTCGETTPGTGTEFEQNNKPKIIRLSYLPSDIVSAFAPTLNMVATMFNRAQHTISETDTPVIVRVIQSVTVENPIVYIYLFTGGKGVYGGESLTQAAASHFFYLFPQNLSIQDAENDSNTVFYYLANLPTGDYLTAANGEGRDLSDAAKIYFFTYNKDGKNFLVKFEGEPGYYGGDYENQLTAANLIPSGINDDEGPAVNQDNEFITKRLYVSDGSINNIANILKDGPLFTITETQNLLVVVNVRNPDATITVNKYLLINVGKGTYGEGRYLLSAFNLELIFSNVPVVSDVEDEPETAIVNFGVLNSQTISQYLNGRSTLIVIQPQDEGYTLFKGTVSGVETSYLWIGAPGTYGAGNSQSTMADFQLLNQAVTPGGSSLLLGDNADNAYPGNKGKEAYDHAHATGNPHGTQMSDIPNLDTYMNARLVGTRAADSDVQVTTLPTTQNRFVDTIRLFNFWAWIKTQAATISGGWNFTGTLKKNNVDIATVNDVAGKLNTGTNTGLAGTGVRIPKVSAAGTITVDDFLTWVAATRELIIGSAGGAGRLNVFSQIFQLAVQDNIASGQATILINANQQDALTFKDKSGKPFLTFTTTTGGEGLIIKQRIVFDEGIFYPVPARQGAITSAGAGVKVYAVNSLGTVVSIPFTVDTMIAMFDLSFIVKNSSASQVIAAKLKAVVKRVGGVITVVPEATEVLLNNSSTPGFTIGIDAIANNSLQFFFQPQSTDSTAYTGAFYEIIYTVN